VDIVQGVTLRLATEGVENVERAAAALDRVNKTTDSATASANKAGTAAKQHLSGIDALVQKISGATGMTSSQLGKMAGVLGGTAIVGAIAAVTKNAINAADALDKMSIRTGVAARDLSILGHGAKLADASMEDLQTAFRTMARTSDQALSGNKKMAQSFTDLGVSAQDLKSKNPRDLFLSIATGLAAIEDPSQRAARAQEVLGRSATTLLPLLNDLSGNGFAKLTAEAERLGVVVENDTARAAAEFNDHMTRLKAGIMGGANTIIQDFLPAANAMAGAMSRNIGEGAGKAMQPLRLLGAVIKGVSSLVTIAASSIAQFGNTIGTVLEGSIAGAQMAMQGRFRDAAAQAKRTMDQLREDRKRFLSDLESDLNNIWDPGARQDFMVGLTPAILDRTGKGGGGVDEAALRKAKSEAERLRKEFEGQRDTLGEINSELARGIRDALQTNELASKLNAIEDRRLATIRQISALTRLAPSDKASAIADANFRAGLERMALLDEEAKKAIDAEQRRRIEAAEQTTTALLGKWRAHGQAVFATMVDSQERASRVTVSIWQKTAGAMSHSFRDAAFGLLSGRGITTAFEGFAQSIQGIMADSLGEWLDGWIEKLNKAALGTEIIDPVTGKGTGEYVAGSGSPAAKAGMVGIQGAGAAYGLYSAGQAGVGKGTNALSGAGSGAMLGFQVGGVYGAVIGAVIGGIAGWLTGNDAQKDYKYGVPRVDSRGRAQLGELQNIGGPEADAMLARIQQQFNTVWNSFANIVLKIPGAIIPELEAIDGRFQSRASGKFLKHFEEWITGTLPDAIAAQFKGVLAEGLARMGLARSQFEAFWTETASLNPEEMRKFWSDLTDGLVSLQRVQDKMGQIRSIYGTEFGNFRVPNWEATRFTDAGRLQQVGESDFAASIRDAAPGLFDIARQMIALSGPERVAAFKQLGASMDQVMDSLIAHLEDIAQTALRLTETFRNARFERQLSRTEDPNDQARLLESEYDRIQNRLANAAALGLSPGEVEALASRGIEILGRLYDLDPSDAAYAWWLEQMGTLEALAESQLALMRDQAVDLVEDLLQQMQPFVDWFLGLPVDLDAAWDLVDGSLRGFATALAELTAEIRNNPRLVDLPPPPPTPPERPGEGGGGGGGGGGEQNRDIGGDTFIEVSVVVEGNVTSELELMAALRDNLLNAIRQNPRSIERAY
jgi:hypothetical protein